MSIYFHYRQNNSGGAFIEDAKSGISVNVIIEAADADDANRRAKTIGLYFDGCYTGIDCPCCGDRWIAAWEGKGTSEPTIFGQPLHEAAQDNRGSRWSEVLAFVHRVDGTIDRYDYAPDGSEQ